MPAGVPAATVSEADDVSDEDLVRAEGVPVGAACWWVGDPLPPPHTRWACNRLGARSARRTTGKA
jgi:hypothetical protein